MIDYVEPRHKVHTITVADFQEQCMDFIDQITAANADGRTIDVLILDGDDKVIALLSNYDEPPTPPGYGILKGEVQILGDIVSPMPAEWFVVSDAAQQGESQ